MTIAPRPTGALTRSLVRLAACVAVLGQLAVVLGGLADGRAGQGMASHVERSGTSIHYAHTDLCAICQARSIQGVGTAGPVLTPDARILAAAPAFVAEPAFPTDLFLPNLSRAPPLRG